MSESSEIAIPDDGESLAVTAHQLRLSGLPWRQVAEQAGYTDAKVAQTCVRQYLQRAAIEKGEAARREALELELARLDALQEAVWPTAMNGDTRAVDTVLKIMNSRAKLLQLEGHDDRVVEQKTLIITGTQDEFVEALQGVVHDD